jgi:hypothetical protein
MLYLGPVFSQRIRSTLPLPVKIEREPWACNELNSHDACTSTSMRGEQSGSKENHFCAVFELMGLVGWVVQWLQSRERRGVQTDTSRLVELGPL